MNEFLDAFISYGRADSKAFAIRLHQELIDRGLNVWFDQNDIPLGVDFQDQIDDGLNKSDNFLFIIAPHAVNSPYCHKEIELAVRRNKRIIPLLHIEQIDRPLWQQRNPEGTDAAWQEYCAKGLNSSFPNMHPTISKINWVYCREGVDDFDRSLAGLLAVISRQQDYVRQHTVFLAKALNWERNQKRSSYLLTGDDRRKAETWLKTRFKEEQPPCLPTDLHCEFISESTKNASNLMTQVFLAHAESDSAISDKIRRSLMREGFTVWTSKTDIRTGIGFEEAIERGIEEADNLVYLLSPAALQSTYCQKEVNYALSLNKRIIPLLAEETDPEQIPEALRSLQYIDLTDNVLETDYQKDESDLLRVLRQEAAYHEEHKILLAKALKWERQHRNPSILLRGYNLRHAEAWLKLAKQHDHHPAIALQEEFITESLRQPPGTALDVFVSYSRADSDFARQINDALQLQGKRTWFDQESIASGTDFQQEIYRGIASANNFLFIISPNSVSSPYCADEVEYAQKLNKRIVTVLHRLVDTATLHPVLAGVQWLDFNQREGDFSANFQELLRTLDTDQDYLQAHTRLLVRALEWDAKQRKEGFLLRGDDLAEAEGWLARGAVLEPKPTNLHREYLSTSRNVENAHEQATQILEKAAREGQRRIRIGTIAMGAGLTVAIAAGLFAYRSVLQAREARASTRMERESVSAMQLFETQQLEALLNAVHTGKDLKKWIKGRSLEEYPVATPLLAVQSILNEISESAEIPIQGNPGFNFSLSPDGKSFLTAAPDNTVQLWNLNGEKLAEFKGHQGEITSASFSPNGKFILTTSEDKTARVWEVSGKPVAKLEDRADILSAEFSPDGQRVLVAYADKFARVWSLSGEATTAKGELLPIAELKGGGASLIEARFTPNGTHIITIWRKTVSNSRSLATIQIWDANGRQSAILKDTDVNLNINLLGREVEISPDGQQILTLGTTSRLWNLSGKLIAELKDPAVWARFSPDGKRILTLTGRNDAQVWDRSGRRLVQIPPPQNNQRVTSAEFSPDGQRIILGLSDSVELSDSVQVWGMAGKQIGELKGHQDSIRSVRFSPNSQQILTASADNTARLWNLSGKQLKLLRGHQEWVSDAAMSADGQHIITASQDKTVRLWNLKNGRAILFGGHQASLNSAEFSLDGKRIITVSKDYSVKVWDTAGKQLTELKRGDQDIFAYARVSPDGNAILTAFAFGEMRLWDASGKFSVLSSKGDSAPLGASFSPDGKQIVTVDSLSGIQLWNRSGQLIATVKGPDEAITLVSFSPTGQHILLGVQSDNKALVWQTSGQPVTELKGHQEAITAASFSPDGTRIVTGSYDNTARIWDLSGKMIAELKAHQGDITSVAFSPDGKRIVTGSADNTSRLWTSSGERIAELWGHQDDVTSVAFSPDGKTIVTASKDNTARLWDLAGRQIGEFGGHEKPLVSASFSPDGQQILTASLDGTARLWKVETIDQLLTNACSWLTSYLLHAPGLSDRDRQVCKGVR